MNREIYIAVANNRSAKKWQNKKITWEKLAQKCSKTIRTAETYAEYKAMSKPEQSDRKDVGGFVGGYLKDGLRKKGSIDFRDVLTLDIDFGQTDTWEAFRMQYDSAAFVYSTHKHTDSAPRIRLVILLSRSVAREEYEAVARAVAAQVGIELFDDTTYQPERLMYWPSTSCDGDWFFDRQDGPALDPDTILATYNDWRNASEWPYSNRVAEVIRSSKEKQGDPTTKAGLVGVFCRCYDIHQVIEEYLSDIYSPAEHNNRYTYKNGSVASGLVVYEDGKFAYSHNATDPCSQHLVNAFDLVRMHRYLDLDEDVDTKTAINNRPSYKAMLDLVGKDKKVKVLLVNEKRSSAVTDFSEVKEGENDDKWKEDLDMHKGKIASTISNCAIILCKAPEFKGKLWHDEFSGLDRYDGCMPWGRSPGGCWTGTDDSCLRKHMERFYGITGKERIADAFVAAANMCKRHPIREYLCSLEWDGTKRLDSLFIDFLGAEDTPLVRQQTRIQFTAAVARIMNPGCKYDYMLVLVGEEGIGKSSILRKLSEPWYNDSISTMEGKEGMENLRKAWVIEVGELMGIKRSEVESIKAYLSRQVDTYRPSYGRHIEEHPRQCVFFGTTNEKNFLKGQEGNRRFWIVETGKALPKMDLFEELTPSFRDQIWAEAMACYENNEPLFLQRDLEMEARKQQEMYNELTSDERTGIIAKFLDIRLPLDWSTRSIDRRRAFFLDSDPLNPDGVVRRDSVSAIEILSECFHQPIDEKARYKTREINAMMKHIPGWELSGYAVQEAYGKQRMYRRVITEEEEEEL